MLRHVAALALVLGGCHRDDEARDAAAADDLSAVDDLGGPKAPFVGFVSMGGSDALADGGTTVADVGQIAGYATSFSGLVLTIEPVIAPRMTPGRWSCNARNDTISSGALPKLAFRSAPTLFPACSAVCSLPSPISRASGTSARADDTNNTGAQAWSAYRAAMDAGVRRSATAKSANRNLVMRAPAVEGTRR